MKKIDFVFVIDNEEEFIETALRLGYDELCLIYSDKDFKKLKEKLKNLQKKTKLKLVLGVILGKNVKRLDNGYTFVADDNPRQFLERGGFFGLLNTERLNFNQVLALLAHKNNISMCFSFNEFLRNKSVMFKAKRNLRIFRKYNVDVIFASFATEPFQMRNYTDMRSFFSFVSR